jgi:hypothetical protein
MADVYAPIRKILDRRFARLYSASQAALCVSEGMREQLGERVGSQVLYPLADVPETDRAAGGADPPARRQPLRVYYCGGLYDYGPMLAELLRQASGTPDVFLQVRGAEPNWPAGFRAEMSRTGNWLDFAPRSELGPWLASAGAFLVTMCFESGMRRRMASSFPSKLTEYAQYGKPIIIWGPEDCSAVRWARKGDRAIAVTHGGAEAVLAAMTALAQSTESQDHYARQARAAAATEFNPAKLQRQFLDAIGDAATQ